VVNRTLRKGKTQSRKSPHLREDRIEKKGEIQFSLDLKRRVADPSPTNIGGSQNFKTFAAQKEEGKGKAKRAGGVFCKPRRAALKRRVGVPPFGKEKEGGGGGTPGGEDIIPLFKGKALRYTTSNFQFQLYSREKTGGVLFDEENQSKYKTNGTCLTLEEKKAKKGLLGKRGDFREKTSSLT